MYHNIWATFVRKLARRRGGWGQRLEYSDQGEEEKTSD